MQIFRPLIYGVRSTRISFCLNRSLSKMTQEQCIKPSNNLLKNVVTILDDFAPTKYAEAWDNVGLLLEPSDAHYVDRMLLTNDLTEEVLDEAIKEKVHLIYSYHPPLFKAIKSIQYDHWKSRILVKCLENRIAIYSPHTSLDVIAGGVNDWLINCFNTTVCAPIIPLGVAPDPLTCNITISASDAAEAKSLKACVVKFLNTTLYNPEGDSSTFVISTSWNNRTIITSWMDQNNIKYTTEPGEKNQQKMGAGRYATLKDTLTLQDAIDKVKIYLSLPFLRLAIAPRMGLDHPVKSVAVCAGSGSSVLLQAPPVDLMVTGEMSHHDALELTHRGTSILLCDHSHSERGFLRHLKDRLAQVLSPHMKLILAQSDRDPLTII